MSSLSVPTGGGDTLGGVRDGLTGVVKMVGAGVWGFALVVLGLWVLFESSLPGFLGGLSWFERGMCGVGMVCGGQLIFLIFVASRVFPVVPLRLRRWIHRSLFVIGVGCMVGFLVVGVMGVGVDGGVG